MRIYIVGNWFTYGPRPNDCYFIVDFVSTVEADARDHFQKNGGPDWELRVSGGSGEFYDWETIETFGS